MKDIREEAMREYPEDEGKRVAFIEGYTAAMFNMQMKMLEEMEQARKKMIAQILS